MPGTDRWRNWAGNQRATGISVVHPAGSTAIAAALQQAATTGRRVRPIGSGHSFAAIGRPEDVQLVLDRHADLVDVTADGLVTVQAGMPLYRLTAELAARGWAMANLGDIDRQTVSGALSTGTHGTGAAFGGLATQVRGLELVLADGTVLRCSATEHAEVFAAARIGLGALGVLSTVTLQAVPAFALRAEEGTASLAEATPRARWRALWEDEVLANGGFAAAVAAGRAVPALVPPLARLASGAMAAQPRTDASHRVFVSRRRVRFREMEYAVPWEAAPEVLTDLRRSVDRSDWRVPFPVEVRVAAADDVPLSTASGQATAYVAAHVPARAEPGEYFATVEAIAGAVGGRPHWGKLHGLDAATLATRYPRFAEFTALRDRLDPSGVLSNAHLDRLLGPVPVRAGRR